MDILIKNIVYKEKNFYYFDNINLRIKEGSICGFIGDNDFILTTIIEIIAGKMSPTEGSIYLIDKDDNDLKSVKDKIAYCPRELKMSRWIRPFDYIYKSGKKFRKNKKELLNEIEELLKFVKLDKETLNNPILDSSTKHKISMAAALIKNPDVLLIDQLTLSHSPDSRNEILEIIDRLRGRMTIIFTTNNVKDVEILSDMAVIVGKQNSLIRQEMEETKSISGANALIIKLDGRVNLREFINELEKQNWVDKVLGFYNGKIKIKVKVLEEAQMELPKLIARYGVSLIEYSSVSGGIDKVYFDTF